MANLIDLSSITSSLIDGLRKILCMIDTIAFGLIDNAYNLIMAFANANDIVNDVDMSKLKGSVYIIIGIFALFRLGILLVNSIIDPDKLTEKGKGISNIFANIIITFVLLIVTPLAFKMAYELQDAIVDGNYINRIFIGGNTESSNDPGKDMQSMVIGSLITPNENVVNGGGCAPGTSCGDAVAAYNDMKEHNELTMPKIAKYISVKGTVGTEQEYVYNYKLLLTFAFGCFIAYVLYSFAIDIAVRLIELVVLEIISPLFIVTYIDPNSAKSGPFSKWLKAVGKTYLSLFIRLATIALMLVFIGMMSKTELSKVFSNVPSGKLLFIIAILIFAKKAPKWIGDMIGMDGESGLGGLGIGKKLGSAALVGGGLASGIAAAKKFGGQKAKNFAANRLRNTAARAAGMIQTAKDRHNKKNEMGKDAYRNLKNKGQGYWAAGRAAAKSAKANNYGADAQGFFKDIGAGLAAGRLTINPDQKSLKEGFQAKAAAKAQAYKDEIGLNESAMKARAKIAEAARIHADGVKVNKEDGKRIEKESFQSKDEFVKTISSSAGDKTQVNLSSSESAIATAMVAKGVAKELTYDSVTGQFSGVKLENGTIIGKDAIMNQSKQYFTPYGQKCIESWSAEHVQSQNSNMVAGINAYNEAGKNIGELTSKLSSIPDTSENSGARDIIKKQIETAKKAMENSASTTGAIIMQTYNMEQAYNGTTDPSKCPGAVRDAAGNYVTTIGRFEPDPRDPDHKKYVYKTDAVRMDSTTGKLVANLTNIALPSQLSEIQNTLAETVSKAKDAVTKEKDKLTGKKE